MKSTRRFYRGYWIPDAATPIRNDGGVATPIRNDGGVATPIRNDGGGGYADPE